MTIVVCKRCNSPVAKSATRQSAIWGGRICNTCSNEIGRIIDNSHRGVFPTPHKTVAPKQHNEKRASIFTRIAQKLFRRRGVR